MTPTEITETTDTQWSPLKKLVFLFLAVYIFFYIFPYPFNFLPLISKLTDYYETGLDKLLIAFSKALLHTPTLQTEDITGSGDRLYNYVRVLFLGLFAVLLAVIICIADRKRPNYTKLEYWLTVALRYYLAFILFDYGIAKVFKLQFSEISAGALESKYGDSTPMGFLWHFMGFSPAYSVFTGLAEVVGGLLLLFRRTVVLGAIILIAVLSNVVMLNLCFDVPVKLASLHYLFFTILLLVPYFNSLVRLFVLGKEAALNGYQPPVYSRKVLIASRSVKVILILFLAGGSLFSTMQFEKERELPPLLLEGRYNTQLFILNHDTLPPLTTDTVRWAKFSIIGNYAKATTMVDSFKTYEVQVNEFAHKIKVSDWQQLKASGWKDTTSIGHLAYHTSGDSLYLSGIIRKDSVQVILKKRPTPKWTLINRGFHWVNESPMNN